MADLKSILGMRTNVAALVYEIINGTKLCVGGFYFIGGNKFIDLDGTTYKLTDKFTEFHWAANNLELIK